MKKAKYIFVTGGVVSGLGKGITAASLGRLLKARGLKVTAQKLDPYLNVDPGTMNPVQHGEVFVTDDGAETDLDLGHYERFIDESLSQNSNLTSGRVYWKVISDERKGVYGGQTIQIIPHVTNEIKKSIVEKDPFEKGDRALLNFGHTLGHAIEKYKNFEMLHGECVALGCICAAFISWKRDLITSDDYYEIRDMFVPFCLPITIEDIDPEQIVSLTHSDKKADNHCIKFILLKKVGKGIIDTTVTDEEMLAALNEIHFTEEDMKA